MRKLALASGVSAVLALSAIAGCATAGGSSGATGGGGTRPTANSQAPRPSANSNPSAPSSGSGTPGEVPGENTVTTAPTNIHPGNDTPADAVDGYLTAVLAGNGTLACTYVDPSSNCPGGHFAPGTGNFTIVKVVTGGGNAQYSGGTALVAVTGKLCSQGSCGTNSDPNVGLPSASLPWDLAWGHVAEAGAGGSGNSLSPIPCEDVTGLNSAGGWYVFLPS